METVYPARRAEASAETPTDFPVNSSCPIEDGACFAQQQRYPYHTGCSPAQWLGSRDEQSLPSSVRGPLQYNPDSAIIFVQILLTTRPELPPVPAQATSPHTQCPQPLLLRYSCSTTRRCCTSPRHAERRVCGRACGAHRTSRGEKWKNIELLMHCNYQMILSQEAMGPHGIYCCINSGFPLHYLMNNV